MDEKDKELSQQEESPIEIHTDGDDRDRSEKEADEKSNLKKLTKAELLEKIDELQQEVEKQCDRFIRSQADMENLRKRGKKEKEEWIKFANETLIKNLLPVMDNLENAISHSHNGNTVETLREGVELTLKGMKDTLEKVGLKEIDAQGQPFDPCFHEAVSQQEDDRVEAGVVLHELQKGYSLNDRLIRPAMVVVSGGGAESSGDDKNPLDSSCGG
jgi:molecular chaperone GrpE